MNGQPATYLVHYRFDLVHHRSVHTRSHLQHDLVVTEDHPLACHTHIQLMCSQGPQRPKTAEEAYHSFF